MNEKTKNGVLVAVHNTLRPTFSNSNTWYYALWVEDNDGGNERCILFTKREIDTIKKRVSNNMEDTISKKMGRMIRVENKNRKHWKASTTYLACTIEENNIEQCLLLTDKELYTAEQRANKNKEDLTKKSFLTDLFD